MRISEEHLVRALGDWQRPGVPLVGSLDGALREAVLDGRLRVGGALPAERRIAAGLGISRGTVVAALARLRDAGWVHTRHGSASTVRLPPQEAEPIAPLSASGHAGSIDLRKAVPAAPRAGYLDAVARAVALAGPALAQDGYPGAGLPDLRAAVADRYTRQGLATRPEQILVTSGARAALALLAAHLRPRVAAVENPTYPRAIAVLREAGARLAGIRVETAGWDPEQLVAAFAAARGGLAYLVPDFQNPTGALMDARTRQAVAVAAAEHRVTVVADETMRDLHLAPEPSWPRRIRRAVLIGSAGKSVWGGLRVGWIRSPETALIDALRLHPLYEPLSAPPLEQLVAVELLADLEPLLQRRRTELRVQRDHLAGLLAAANGPRGAHGPRAGSRAAGPESDGGLWRFTAPDGGLVLWLRLTGTRADVAVARARAAGIELAPGPRYAVDGTLAHYLRVPFTPPPAALDRIAATLATACRP
ncbi:aminotransferase-like domain-containing protein [Streptomyces sp. NBC_00239]|uniref:aminotransferase-like domain-containing protein n=1 Tax=Streptomyces sp. NBC_00239 TaxID=2903640 RepID=UPI002E27EE50|nr:PLP-dependent aminotransferase family protein [Streptomyces sp. NBC_00239]